MLAGSRYISLHSKMTQARTTYMRIRINSKEKEKVMYAKAWRSVRQKFSMARFIRYRRLCSQIGVSSSPSGSRKLGWRCRELVEWDRAYLAADDWGRYGQRNQVYHRGHECGETSSGVKLHNGRIRLRPGNDHEKNPSEK